MTTMTLTTGRPGNRHLMAPAGAVASTAPVPRCPSCAAVLDGGPVAYHCTPCGRGVMAADLDTDYHPPASRHQEGGPS